MAASRLSNRAEVTEGHPPAVLRESNIDEALIASTAIVELRDDAKEVPGQ